MKILMSHMTESRNLLQSLDSTLDLEIITYQRDYSVHLVVRDTSRGSSQTWKIGGYVAERDGIKLPLSLSSCRSIKSYFDAARLRHPESYRTCACHAHTRSNQ